MTLPWGNLRQFFCAINEDASVVKYEIPSCKVTLFIPILQARIGYMEAPTSPNGKASHIVIGGGKVELERILEQASDVCG